MPRLGIVNKVNKQSILRWHYETESGSGFETFEKIYFLASMGVQKDGTWMADGISRKSISTAH